MPSSLSPGIRQPSRIFAIQSEAPSMARANFLTPFQKAARWYRGLDSQTQGPPMPLLLWTQRQDIGPSARAGAAMAHDEERHMTVLFGGDGLDPGTWEWDGRYWTQVSDMGPPLRRSAAMAWDSSAKRLILLGGFPMPAVEAPDALGDTWEWTSELDTARRCRSRRSLRLRYGRGYEPRQSCPLRR